SHTVDIFTHALVSVAVARIATPRADRVAWASVVLAGTIADLDEFGARFGATTYLHWHRTYSHSVASALVIAAICAAAYLALRPKPSSAPAPPASTIIALLFGMSLAHVALDACQSDGVMLFWPISQRRIHADWLASIDPWIIAILVAAILFPELLRLVSSE